MSRSSAYVSVAVGGPLRRTFTYHFGNPDVALELGQRVVVPFGRTRKIGYYLGPANKPTGIETKSIAAIPDALSFFPPELFRLCVWMADYYFCNPADCFASSLPGVFKSKHAINYRWTHKAFECLPVDFKVSVRPGKSVSADHIGLLRQNDPKLLSSLIQQGAITETLVGENGVGPSVISGYVVNNPEEWDDFFSRRRRRLEIFHGMRTADELKQAGWTDHYIGLATRNQLLSPVRQRRATGILDFVAPRDDVSELQLTEEQQIVVEEIRSVLTGGFQPFLLHGVTGSGKTLVYCHLAREVLRRGQTVLVLTPEISLSGVLLSYFRGFFGDRVTVIHSAMTERERLESWQGIRQGDFRIVIGPRSAVVAPLEHLGLIVVDEEQDGSYKQDDPAPRFNGRDAAIMRARISGVPVLLGSASPSLESYHNAETGRYRLFRIQKRPGSATLPTVHVIDMRGERIKGDLPFLSLPLKQKVESRLDRNEQVILFLNRRGYAPQLKCADCGYVPRCPHCDVKMTYHKVGRKLSCHYCGYLSLDYHVCARCGGSRLMYLGAGTQKVEESIPRLFERASVVRFDSDTASGRKNAYRILEQFASRQYNLLLGTQMVTKGLDLSGVTLVGVLSADQGLDRPDFRANEKSFAQLLQVAGRSGRKGPPGEVAIQTFYPDEPVIDDAARQDYQSFYEREITSRRESQYPPFCRLINIILSGKNEKMLEMAMKAFARRCAEVIARSQLSARILGPAPCPLYYLRRRYRRHVLIKTDHTVRLVSALTHWELQESRFGLPAGVKVVVDVDPDDMM
jgi:primosomal protein N' (replication factor Y)